MIEKNFLLGLAISIIFTMVIASLSMASSHLSYDDKDSLLLAHGTSSDVITQQNTEPSKPASDLSSIIRQKSPSKAFLFSAVVPGTGEFYSGAKRGIAFVVSEIAFWVTYFALHGRAEELKDGYLNFVDEHIAFEEDSPATSTKNWTLEDYEHATQTDNWHYVYTEHDGNPVDRVGKFYWKDLPEDKIDESGGALISKFRAEAYNKRSSTNRKFKQAKICLGLVVVNHIVSAVDARISAISHNKRASRTSTQLSLTPVLSPSGYSGACLVLSRQF